MIFHHSSFHVSILYCHWNNVKYFNTFWYKIIMLWVEKQTLLLAELIVNDNAMIIA